MRSNLLPGSHARNNTSGPKSDASSPSESTESLSSKATNSAPKESHSVKRSRKIQGATLLETRGGIPVIKYSSVIPWYKLLLLITISLIGWKIIFELIKQILK